MGFWTLGLYGSLGKIPVEVASAIGGAIVRINARWNRREITAGARRNLQRHQPCLDDAGREVIIWRFLDNVGRFMAEFALIERIEAEGRTSLFGALPVIDLLGREPVLAIVLHTGNWELFGPALRMAGIPAATFYEPPASAVERRIAEQTRRAAGFTLLTPDHRGIRDALAMLRANKVVAIFGDEARQGRTMAPLFGRPAHARCNLAIAAKLARRTGARIVIVHSVRKNSCRFDLRISEPFTLSTTETTTLADVAALNARIEPIILSLLDQWYYLDDLIDDVQMDGSACR